MKFEIPKIWSELINAGDLEGVLALYEESALLLATFDAQPLDQPVQRRKYFENLLNRPGAGVEIDETTLVHSRRSEGVYQATGLYTFFYEENDVLVRQPARFTFIVSVDESPLILHHHSSVVPNADSD
jgi:hypothetical protein